jgi:(4-(4-[2-(gamma-L-glutamylamino)ethyl]phenoxymethyl)furan-2-yl)methanamine synthase
MADEVLGLDIGGANLKAATTSGVALSRPFALWKHPERLADELRQLLQIMPPFHRVAVTMTGELCDCFETKRQGVNAILDAVEAAVGSLPILVWQTSGQFTDVASARKQTLPVAAANWLALAKFAGRFALQAGALVIDVGTTTTDIIPLWDGQPQPHGRTDPERLQSGELVYTGIKRTPVCALLGSDGMAEFFATTNDVYLLLGKVRENAADTDTADGRPATREFAHGRLARMIGGDNEITSEAMVTFLAEFVASRQRDLLCEAARSVAAQLPSLPERIVLAGSGEFLAREVADAAFDHGPINISLTEKFGPELSQCACAYAVAVLANEQPVL